MRKDLTDITLVVDRSGSMQEIRSDAEGGINSFIEQQAQLEGEAIVTIVQFDSDYEFVAKGLPARDVPKYELVPRGSTALLDAIGRAINETGARLNTTPEAERPGLVVFVITTDGEENASREFTLAKIREMIEHQQANYNWQFTFLGADQDAFAEANAMGMRVDGVANVAKSKFSKAYHHTGNKVARMRSQTSAMQAVDNSFSKEELDDMVE